MTIRGDESSYYTAASLVIWVEDEVTRSYLYAVWEDDASIAIRIAGSKNAVLGIVRDARTQEHRHVFGLVDRDFQRSNKADWFDLAKDISVFVPAATEIENYLIDPEALAGCNLNTHQRGTAEIKVRL